GALEARITRALRSTLSQPSSHADLGHRSGAHARGVRDRGPLLIGNLRPLTPALTHTTAPSACSSASTPDTTHRPARARPAPGARSHRPPAGRIHTPAEAAAGRR